MKYFVAVFLFLCVNTVYAQHRTVPITEEFKVTGAIKQEKVFHIADIMRCTQDNIGDIVIKNHRGEPKDTVKGLKGVLITTFLDSVELNIEKPKEYAEYYITFVASDGYKNVYSWNEIFNTDVGRHIYIITEMDGKPIAQMPQRILVMSLADANNGRRHLIGLAKIEFRKVE